MSSPVYRRPPEKVSSGNWRRMLSLRYAENVFFVAATGFCFYYAFVIVQQGGNLPQKIVWSVVFWAVIAYLAMPRLNQILTTIYVPDYFMGRTRVADGVLGDPVNLAVRGSADQIHTVMQRAGWMLADPVTLRSSWGIVISSLTRRSYPTAPVSPLFLFGAMQDFAYQQEVDGNASQRHHVRFFRCPPGWILPGGHRVDWLASGSYDRAVGLSLFTLQVTHKIDANIDVERDYIIDTVQHAVPQACVEVIRDFSTGYHSRNGGGDLISTDGDLPVLQLGHVDVAAAANTDTVEHVGRTDVSSRPIAVLMAVVLSLLSTIVSSGGGVYELTTTDPRVVLDIPDAGAAHTVWLWTITLVVVLAVSLLALAYQTYRGRTWARVAMLGLAAVSLASHVGIGETNAATLMDIGIGLGIMYSLTTTSARIWTREMTRVRHPKGQGGRGKKRRR